jgi:hypothetical protein
MNRVHLIIGILALILGLFFIGFGIYRVYKDETTSGATAKAANFGWGLIILGIVFVAVAAILFFAGRSSNKNSVEVVTKKTK